MGLWVYRPIDLLTHRPINLLQLVKFVVLKRGIDHAERDYDTAGALAGCAQS
jgi:hypothetical protein